MSVQTALALLLALASTTLTNVAYLREHDAAAALPALSLRRPLHSAWALLSDRSWFLGFALEGGGFALYVLALALAPLTLVQSIAAGGIGILAFVSARASGRRQDAGQAADPACGDALDEGQRRRRDRHPRLRLGAGQRARMPI